MFSSAAQPLIAKTLIKPVRREVPGTGRPIAPELRSAARDAVHDPRDAKERVIDSVVDRMLKELSW